MTERPPLDGQGAAAGLRDLGNALREQGRLDEAIECHRQAVAIKPDYPEVHNSLGVALQDLGRLDEAIALYRRALELKPGYPQATSNLGAALQEQGRLDEAIDCLRQAVALKPDSGEAHTNLAITLLARGDLAEGWREYEWRWKTAAMVVGHRHFPQPQWRGEAGEGRSLLIHAEQGLGDTLQFCRYALLAAERGLRVTMEVQDSLVRLLDGMPGVERVVARSGTPPAADFHCPLLSLPLALGTTLATIPAHPSYLRADTEAVAVWGRRLSGAGPRIGLAWAGNPRHHSAALAALDRRRSIAPERLAPLFELPGPSWFSLQKGGPPAPSGFPLIDVMAEITDFADTAALIAHLDLVISVDTAIVHLAAAMGKPVWMLNRFDACWRWLRGRDDSPWYPTLRLFTQKRPGDWEGVIEAVKAELR